MPLMPICETITPETLHKLKNVGDPLADAAVIEAAGADGARLLDQAVRSGVSAQTPPAAAALMADAQALDWVDQAALRRGSEAYLSIGATWLGLALGPGSLTHTYSSPSIARVLAETGNLTQMALRRLQETGAWNIATAQPDGLLPGHDGYIQNLQVRLLHARVRQGLLRRGWNVAERGAPISQVDLIRTWLDFTYVPFSALPTLGVSFTDAEVRDLYVLWQAAAHLLGVTPAVVRLVVDQASAAELMTMVDAMDGPPDANSRALTVAMLDAMGDLLGPRLGVSAATGKALAAATLRRLHGDAFADSLGVRKNWASWILPVIAAGNRFRRWRAARNPALRAAAIAEGVQLHAQRQENVPGLTTYERAAQGHAGGELPVTRAP